MVIAEIVEAGGFEDLVSFATGRVSPASPGQSLGNVIREVFNQGFANQLAKSLDAEIEADDLAVAKNDPARVALE